MKVDTVICYDPWGHYEENPDHYITARCVEAACWMAGGRWDLPEHFEAGLQPHAVQEKYYFARGPQLVNRVVDIGSVFDQKVEANLANVTQGPAGEAGAALRSDWPNKSGPADPGRDGCDANGNTSKHRSERGRRVGRRYCLSYAEPSTTSAPAFNARLYIKQHAVPLA